VFDWVAKAADGRLGGRPESLLVIDESAVSKKGEASAGVGRQYNGRLGKVDNCQAGVFAVLNCGAHSALIDAELYLPEEWIGNPERCKKAGIPEQRQVFRTKIDMARAQIQRACTRGVRFACVAFDAFYGRDQGLLDWIDQQGLTYCADVPSNAYVFTTKPMQQDRPEKMTQSAKKAEVVAKTLRAKPKKAHDIILREGENGIVEAKVWATRVWVWPEKADHPSACWLIVRECDDGTQKISLSNAPKETQVKRLAFWQAGRFYAERAFANGKSHVGMASYQARGWTAWQHHMAMVALALFFIMEERMLLGASHPLISARDIVELLDWYVRGPRTEDQVLQAFENRQRRRERKALIAQKRKRKKLGMPEIKKLQTSTLPK
jgi:SRSO17 transposase